MRRSSLVSGPAELRNAVAFGRDPLGFLDGLRGGTDGLVRARFGVGPSLVFVADPTLVRRVLVDEHDRYRRPDILSSRTEALTANGLIQSDGDLWRRQRSRLRPLFGGEALSSYADTIVDVADETVSSWVDGADLDLYTETTSITLRVIARELLGTELSREEIDRIRRTSAAVAREFTVSPTALVRQLLPTPPSTEYREAIAETHEWAERLIDEYRGREASSESGGSTSESESTENLVTTMLAAEREGSDLPPNLVRDEVLTFLFAGYETTALTLSFALWYVSRHPGVAADLRAEARDASDGGLGWRDLQRLTGTERVVRESLRLRPASWGVFREARVGSRLGDDRLRPGDFLMLPQWTLHRDWRYFDDPDRFDPDRWRDRDPNSTPAYFPFGAGPQSCIGGRLATTEATLVLARVLREFDVETTTRAVDDLRPAGVLQPRHGVPARVERTAE